MGGSKKRRGGQRKRNGGSEQKQIGVQKKEWGVNKKEWRGVRKWGSKKKEGMNKKGMEGGPQKKVGALARPEFVLSEMEVSDWVSGACQVLRRRRSSQGGRPQSWLLLA